MAIRKKTSRKKKVIVKQPPLDPEIIKEDIKRDTTILVSGGLNQVAWNNICKYDLLYSMDIDRQVRERRNKKFKKSEEDV